jgi:Zn finger protein HypA/HybF involved in hydrogenase expression
MSDFNAKLPIGDGNVIELSVVRDSFMRRRIGRKCKHLRCELDESLAELKCNDCGERLSPVAYIKVIVEAWDYYEQRIQQYEETKKRFEAKTRCRCEHCQKMTRVRPATAAQVRALEQNAEPKL